MNHNETSTTRNLLHVETRILHRPGSQRTSYWNSRDTLIIRTTMRRLSCLKLGCRVKVTHGGVSRLQIYFMNI